MLLLSFICLWNSLPQRVVNKLNRDKKRCSSTEERNCIKRAIKFHLNCLRVALRNQKKTYIDYVTSKYKNEPWKIIRRVLRLDLDFQDHSSLPGNIHELETDFLNVFVRRFSTSELDVHSNQKISWPSQRSTKKGIMGQRIKVME